MEKTTEGNDESFSSSSSSENDHTNSKGKGLSREEKQKVRREKFIEKIKKKCKNQDEVEQKLKEYDTKLSERELRKKERKEGGCEKHLKNLELLKKRKYYDEEEDNKLKSEFYKGVDVQNTNYSELHLLTTKTYKHGKRRENIFSIIDRHPDYTLRCVYTDKVLEKEDGTRLEKCDEEHSVPQSYQAGTKKGCGRDMHQIFAASKNANGSRGNKPFGFSDKLNNNLKEEKEGGTFHDGTITSFVPKCNKGAVARSTLYILVTYDKAMDKTKFPKEFLGWIIQHAANEEVTLWEKHRNYELHKLQKNRNPFIDYPELAKTIDFSDGFQDK